MRSYEKILDNALATQKLGQKIALELKNKPALIYLVGELGAGKTTFTQGFIQKLLGDGQAVLSPTYSYMQRYEHDPVVYHFDLYRIDKPHELHELGLDSFLDDDTAIRLVEWPERLTETVGRPNIEIRLTTEGQKRLAKVIFYQDL